MRTAILVELNMNNVHTVGNKSEQTICKRLRATAHSECKSLGRDMWHIRSQITACNYSFDIVKEFIYLGSSVTNNL